MVRVIHAQFLDDCWEPGEAGELLRRLAAGEAGVPICLRVERGDARIVPDDYAGTEAPGTASYLWALWSGAPPTLEELVALHAEHVRVTRLGAR